MLNECVKRIRIIETAENVAVARMDEEMIL